MHRRYFTSGSGLGAPAFNLLSGRLSPGLADHLGGHTLGADQVAGGGGCRPSGKLEVLLLVLLSATISDAIVSALRTGT